jgi:hypothetical protein
MRSKWSPIAALGVMVMLHAAPAARAQECGWSALEGADGVGLNDRVYALSVFDDSNGPALYAGGRFYFDVIGGVGFLFIARWDGSAWSPVGTGMSHSVRTLTVFDEGFGRGPALFAGGIFSHAGVMVKYIARWDGSTWSALESPGGVGMNDWVAALTVFDDGSGGGPALYAAGAFPKAGGITVNRIARWDGSAFSALEGPGGVGLTGDSFPPWVLALTVFDDGCGGGPALYAGGNFITAGGVTVNRVARWDGSTWSALESPGGVGMNDMVWNLTVFDDGSGGGPALYAGGAFTTAGGVTVNGIARWDGHAWSALAGPGGVGVGGSAPHIYTLGVFDDGSGDGPALYAGGAFTTAGGVTVNQIARWDGSGWSALAGPGDAGISGPSPYVFALTEFDDGTGDGPALYVGGQFTTAGGVTAINIARWSRPVDNPCPADFTGDGVLDLADIVAFVTAFGAQNPVADFAEPFGVFDIADLTAFVAAFLAGCN